LALAQTSAVAHLAVHSGNGQVACICTSSTLQAFQPISVKATDVNGNPVAGATVTWTNTSGLMNLPNPTTTTDGTGVATEDISFTVFNNFYSTAVPYDVFTIQAASNNQSVTFSETQSLVTSQGSSIIEANPPQFNGASLADATLSGNVGTTLSTPIQTQVAGLEIASNGVGNVSVRIANGQTSPALSCAYQGGYADPGSVLTNSQGNSSCYPVFSGSGTGTFSVIVGGVAGSSECTNSLTGTASACYLQTFGPYTFTSVPGAPAAFQIAGGNNQVAPIGQPLSPLVAKLVDANGNAVSGAAVVWSVVPAGAVALSNGNNVTDNNGEVSQTVSLDILASSGAAITVALQSNPSISATFQETVQGALTALNKISGDKQSAQVGTAFAAPLVVQVVNASGPVANYPVQYLVSGQVSLSSTTAATAANGYASVNATAGTIAGSATVTAVAGALTQTFTLTITTTPTGPTPNGLAIVSGNNQSAQTGAEFSQPLVVQVNSSSGPVSGYTVNFSTTGPVSISNSSEVTNSSGQVSINASAGNASGAATVTASISGYQATFNLTVAPPGPPITAASFLNAASRQAGQLSPCGLAIISAQGLTPDGTADYTLAPITGRYPKTVNHLTVTFGGIPAPIVSVAMGVTNPEVTLQVPCEVTPASSVPVVVNVNGGGTATANIPIYAVSPGIFQTVMSDGTSRAVAVRSDGTFADIGGTDFSDPLNPVRLSEVVRFYVTGLGQTSPVSVTDTLEDPNSYIYNVQNNVTGTLQAGFPGTGILFQNVSAHQAPGLIGVYEVQATVPSNAPTGNNVPFYIAITPAGSSASPTQSPNSIVPIGQ
jgi:uncharacterized protein (TIGR03437 family)